MFPLWSAQADLISLGWGLSVLPDGLQITAGLKIMYVISNHTVQKLQINYILLQCDVFSFLIG